MLYHPTSRQISLHGIVNLLNKFPYIRFRLEPMGTVSPKVTVGEDFKHIKSLMNKGLSLLCPAQAYPKPMYR